MIPELRRRVAARLAELAEPVSADVRPRDDDAAASPSEPAVRPARRQEQPKQPLPRTVRVEFAPGDFREVPAAIAFDLLHGVGWPRRGRGVGLALPGSGPLVTDQRADDPAS